VICDKASKLIFVSIRAVSRFGKRSQGYYDRQGEDMRAPFTVTDKSRFSVDGLERVIRFSIMHRLSWCVFEGHY